MKNGRPINKDGIVHQAQKGNAYCFLGIEIMGDLNHSFLLFFLLPFFYAFLDI